MARYWSAVPTWVRNCCVAFTGANRSWIIYTQYIQQIEPAISGGFDVSLHADLKVDIYRRQASTFKQGWRL